MRAFLREARVAGPRPSSEHGPIFTISVSSADAILVMELGSGTASAATCHRHKEIPLQAKLEWLAQAGRRGWLAAGPCRGIVNRDVKPGKIMITVRRPLWRQRTTTQCSIRARRSRKPRVATKTNSRRRLGMYSGTQRYWHPRPARGAKPDARSSVLVRVMGVRALGDYEAPPIKFPWCARSASASSRRRLDTDVRLQISVERYGDESRARIPLAGRSHGGDSKTPPRA